MTTGFILLFIIPVILVFYTYVAFPAILCLYGRRRKRAPVPLLIPETWPEVTILISAYNEEAVLAEKLESIVSADYPDHLKKVLVGSDGSHDATVRVASEFAARHPWIQVMDFDVRRGKPSVINDLVGMASSEIIVLTDANVIFDKQVLKHLVKHFSEEKTGLVGANILNKGIKPDGISHQEMSYIQRENRIKYYEGLLWGTMMGPFGGCYAMRKNLFQPVPDNYLVDDFFICMHIILKGYACINELEAVCYEDVSNDIFQEYIRKARISAGNFQNLSSFRKLLLRPFSPSGFCFLSHKVLRWFTPFFILASTAGLGIMTDAHPVYGYLFAAEVFLIFSPLIDWLLGISGIHIRFLRFVAYFSFMNLALLKGFFRYVSGIHSNVWTPTKRNA